MLPSSGFGFHIQLFFIPKLFLGAHNTGIVLLLHNYANIGRPILTDIPHLGTYNWKRANNLQHWLWHLTLWVPLSFQGERRCTRQQLKHQDAEAPPIHWLPKQDKEMKTKKKRKYAQMSRRIEVFKYNLVFVVTCIKKLNKIKIKVK